jgi:hypothetical protein
MGRHDALAVRGDDSVGAQECVGALKVVEDGPVRESFFHEQRLEVEHVAEFNLVHESLVAGLSEQLHRALAGGVGLVRFLPVGCIVHVDGNRRAQQDATLALLVQDRESLSFRLQRFLARLMAATATSVS